MKKIIQIIIISWLLLLTVSCTNNSCYNTTNIKKTQKSKVVVFDSTSAPKKIPTLNEHEIIGGWLKEHLEQQVVLDRLGLPEKKGDDEYWGATGNYVQKWEYNALGIKLEMESESQGGVKKVRSIIIVQPCKLSTSQGIGIGSTGKIVREKYYKLIDASNSNNELIVVGSVYGGSVFTLKNGFVSKIFIGAAAE